MGILLALVMGIFIGGAAGYLGSLMITKRMSLMAGALGHLTLPGVSLALLYDFDVSIGALLFLVFGSVIIWVLEQATKLHVENLTAIVFSLSLSVAFLFLPKTKAYQALIGDISHISTSAVVLSVCISLIIFFITKKLYYELVLTSISRDVACSEGINVTRNSFIYLTAISLMVALGVRMVGGLMTAALIAIPAGTSTNLSKNIFQYAYVSLLVGSISCVIGIIACYVTQIPAGPLIIISSGLLFVISLLFKR
jgi:zinc transport system permease protein